MPQPLVKGKVDDLSALGEDSLGWILRAVFQNFNLEGHAADIRTVVSAYQTQPIRVSHSRCMMLFSCIRGNLRILLAAIVGGENLDKIESFNIFDLEKIPHTTNITVSFVVIHVANNITYSTGFNVLFSREGQCRFNQPPFSTAIEQYNSANPAPINMYALYSNLPSNVKKAWNSIAIAEKERLQQEMLFRLEPLRYQYLWAFTQKPDSDDLKKFCNPNYPTTHEINSRISLIAYAILLESNS